MGRRWDPEVGISGQIYLSNLNPHIRFIPSLSHKCSLSLLQKRDLPLSEKDEKISPEVETLWNDASLLSIWHYLSKQLD